MFNFGPPLKSEHTEKEWTKENPYRKLHLKTQIIIDDLQLEYDILFWIYFCKFYGAEWIEED